MYSLAFLFLVQVAEAPVTPERQLRVLKELKEFTDEQSSANHAFEAIKICERTTEQATKSKVPLWSVMVAESKKQSWNNLQTNAMMHDCLIYSFGYGAGGAAEILAEALRKQGK